MTPLPQPGSLVANKYRVLCLLGVGGMGAVFRARHLLMERDVALKWLRPELAESKDARDRFLREARAAARIHHPNVITVFDVGEHRGALFMVMELLEGESFEDLVQRGDVSIGSALSLLMGAMRGVAAVHRHGIIHRDIKPENLLVMDGLPGFPTRIKVLDFGISKLSDEPTHDLGVTHDGAALGTPLFMSYEQLCLARDVDVRADVYSFGVLLYRTLTGIIPFDAESIAAVAVLIATYRPPSPRTLRPELPEELSNLVMRAMAFERDDRYPNMDALIEELETMTLSYHVLQAPVGRERGRLQPVATLGLASIDGPPVEPSGTMPPAARIPAWVPVGSAAVLLTLLLAGSVWWLRPSPKTIRSASVAAMEAPDAPAVQPVAPPSPNTFPMPSTHAPLDVAAPTAPPPKAKRVPPARKPSVPAISPTEAPRAQNLARTLDF